MARILVVHSPSAANYVLTEILEKLQHQASDVEDISEAFAPIAEQSVDLIFIEGKADWAIKSLCTLKNDPHTATIPAVVVTSTATSTEVIEVMQAGAFDHLSKSASPQELDSVIKRAISRPQKELTLEPETPAGGSFLIGLSPPMRHAEKLIGAAAMCDTTVLIYGETGTGKDTVARTIHGFSRHRLKPLTVIDCTAVPEDYESFISLTPGAQGTVILDEIGDLNPHMQAMLVRALKEATPDSNTTSAVRIIATTQYDLISMVKEKQFREDLYYRLNVFPILLPPLRERGSDILALAETFLQQAQPEAPKHLSSTAAKLLLDYEWPGNVRELQNLIYHLTVTVKASTIEAADLNRISPTQNNETKENETDTEESDYYTTMASVEKRLLTQALEKSSGSRAEAARILGINRQLLYAKLRAHGLMNL